MLGFSLTQGGFYLIGEMPKFSFFVVDFYGFYRQELFKSLFNKAG